MCICDKCRLAAATTIYVNVRYQDIGHYIEKHLTIDLCNNCRAALFEEMAKNAVEIRNA